MATYDAIIDEFVAGDDLSVERTVTGVPATTTLTNAWFTVKRKLTDADADAILQKIITSVSTSSGQIDDTGADGTGHVIFLLVPADTVLLTPLSEYHYDIQVKTSAGKIYTPESGKIVAQIQVTKST